MFMNRLLNTSSSTGSAWCRRQALRARGRALQQQVVQRGQRARQPGSSTVVALRSAMMAGP
jgi:hypothetical protein